MNSIVVPDTLPEILKNYVKAAIRSQPEDIVSWSAEYFKTTDEQCAPINKYEKCSTAYKQDRTMFRILAFQLGTTVGTKERIEEVWSDLSLDFSLLEQIYGIGKFHSEHVDMVEFLGIAFGHWTKSLKETVLMCCEAFCKCLATDGYFLHVDTACKLYRFLAKLDCSLPADDGSGSGHLVGVGDRNNDDDDGGGDNNNNNTKIDTGKTAAMKTYKSLDIYQSVPDENDVKSNVSTSLESIFVPPTTTTTTTTSTLDAADFRRRDSALPYVPGIGAAVPDARVQRVIDYFQKCSADNGGYVYDFDIESDHCPRLDAVIDQRKRS